MQPRCATVEKRAIAPFLLVVALLGCSSHDLEIIQGQLGEIQRQVSRLQQETSSQKSVEELGGRRRSEESLIESLCDKEWLPSDLTIPTGAVLGRTLVLARINFLKALHYGVEPCRNA